MHCWLRLSSCWYAAGWLQGRPQQAHADIISTEEVKSDSTWMGGVRGWDQGKDFRALHTAVDAVAVRIALAAAWKPATLTSTNTLRTGEAGMITVSDEILGFSSFKVRCAELLGRLPFITAKAMQDGSVQGYVVYMCMSGVDAL